jgi:hypothetical protein
MRTICTWSRKAHCQNRQTDRQELKKTHMQNCVLLARHNHVMLNHPPYFSYYIQSKCFTCWGFKPKCMMQPTRLLSRDDYLIKKLSSPLSLSPVWCSTAQNLLEYWYSLITSCQDLGTFLLLPVICWPGSPRNETFVMTSATSPGEESLEYEC